MKPLLLALLCALCAMQSRAGERVELYARLTQDLTAELTDGSTWQMDKGDCFPVIAYRESHTRLILRLGGASFIVAAEHAVVVGEKETADAITRYRRTLENYINGFSARWKAQAEAAKGK